MISEEKVIFFIVNSINLSDDFSHSRSAPWGWSLRVAVGKVDEDIMKNIVKLHDQVLSKILHINILGNKLYLLNLQDGLTVDWMQIEHHVFGWKLHGLLFFEIFFE